MQSLQMSNRLLAIEQRKGTSGEGRIRTFPAVLALLNLFFCAYTDEYLRGDVTGQYLSLFLIVESGMLVLIAIGTFMRSSLEILLKTSVFPITPWGILLFVLLSFVRKPASVALWLTTLLFLVVLYFRSILVTSAAITLYGLLVLNVLLLTTVVCVKLARSSQPVAGIAVLSIFAIVVI